MKKLLPLLIASLIFSCRKDVSSNSANLKDTIHSHNLLFQKTIYPASLFNDGKGNIFFSDNYQKLYKIVTSASSTSVALIGTQKVTINNGFAIDNQNNIYGVAINPADGIRCIARQQINGNNM